MTADARSLTDAATLPSWSPSATVPMADMRTFAHALEHLGLSERTLHRRLAADGVSYQELLDEVRKAAAGRSLDESTLAIREIAYLLGYSEPAALHRAFKRWSATTPEQFRARARSR